MGEAMKCPACDVNYPEDLLSQLMLGGAKGPEYTPPICGICALELTNIFHGTGRKVFRGTMAGANRSWALMHRRRTHQTPRVPCEIKPCPLDHTAMAAECLARKCSANCPECGVNFPGRLKENRAQV